MGIFKEFLSLKKIQFMFVELLNLANNHIHVWSCLQKPILTLKKLRPFRGLGLPPVPSYFDKLKSLLFREALHEFPRSASPNSRSASRNSRSASSKGWDKFKSNWYLYRWQYDLSINSLGDRSASRHFGKRFTNFAKRFAKELVHLGFRHEKINVANFQKRIQY